ncbi:glycosyltransferase family 4 protein [Pacificimonas flava]|uniref:Glycosyltransferase n=1 Tax=Pacificimonas flava TaxID=1234595 RepID=M2U646_9SPHN|nr:glycosyltransferase family 1 protein [Pacificimonas flava]EMD83478.1 Glycosyltransferase [Pacificimonas flava]MBB5278966.1 glycosyltransferase involved in cell wall biosynthesis [Pacificimonas flava]
MEPSDLRVALFSGNYNYVKDGANQALNRLTAHMLSRGVNMRIYSPTVPQPAFPATGDLVSIRSVALPGRDEYRFGFGLVGAHRDLRRYRPNIVHIASPDVIGHRAAHWAGAHDVPLVASVHTRFETYFRYYKLGWAQPLGEAILRRLYGKCEEIYAPSQSMVEVLREQHMNPNVHIWSRGIDHDLYGPERRDLEWRRSLGIDDADVVILFVGRLVLEKGLGTFAETLRALDRRGQRYRAMFVGDGPAGDWIRERAPQGIFTGFLGGTDLACAYASADIMFNPSSTETFGNVTLEAMASGLPVVAARATGSTSLVAEGESGLLTTPDDVEESADALCTYLNDPQARACAGEVGRARSRAYDWTHINDGLLQRYLAVASKGTSR